MTDTAAIPASRPAARFRLLRLIGLLARPHPVAPSRVGVAVRRDWRVDGTHEFIGFRLDPVSAAHVLARDASFWRRGPARPRLSLVRISFHEYRLHHLGRRLCRAPDCPVAAPAGGATAA